MELTKRYKFQGKMICVDFKEAIKGFLQLMYMSGQLNRKNSCF